MKISNFIILRTIFEIFLNAIAFLIHINFPSKPSLKHDETSTSKEEELIILERSDVEINSAIFQLGRAFFVEPPWNRCYEDI